MNPIKISPAVYGAIQAEQIGSFQEKPKGLPDGDVEILVDDEVLACIKAIDNDPDVALRIRFNLPPRGA